MGQAVRVTVCIPVYNRSEALRPTLESVLRQTMGQWELIIVDDGSQDDTGEVVASYDDPRIIYVRQRNAGQAAARNVGLEQAKGPYVAFLDHDDVWLPNKLERQTEFLDAHPECGVVYARWRGCDDEGNLYGPGNAHEATGWVYEDFLWKHNFLCTMSLPLLRTDLVREVGGFDPSTDISDDWALFMKLALKTQFGFIPEELLHYNIGTPGKQTNDLFRVYRSEQNCLRQFRSEIARQSREVRARSARSWAEIYGPLFRERALWLFRAGDYRAAWKHYSMLLRLDPTEIRDPQLVKDLLALCKRSVQSRGAR